MRVSNSQLPQLLVTSGCMLRSVGQDLSKECVFYDRGLSKLKKGHVVEVQRFGCRARSQLFARTDRQVSRSCVLLLIITGRLTRN